MACSFRHRKEFIPSISSIKIIDREIGSGYAISLAEEGDGQIMACDGCEELAMPLCIQYCRKREDLEEILKRFKKKSRDSSQHDNRSKGRR
jgi:hypothetical protein